MPVMTVLGPVEPQSLGVTLMHEHLVHAVEDEPMDDEALVVSELAGFAECGGRTIVDLTTVGIGGPEPAALARIAAASGLAIVAGTGFYIEDRVPERLRALTDDGVRRRLTRDLREGFPGTAVKAGIIGEIGCGTLTSSVVTDFERRVLLGAAASQRDTGATITVHTQIDLEPQGLTILDILEDAGADLSRVVLAHCDARIDLPYWRAILRRGAIVELSAIGRGRHDGNLLDGSPVPDSSARIAGLSAVIADGYGGQVLLSHDVCARSHLRRFGGGGFSGLLTDIVPRLHANGVSDQAIQTMLVATPARLLDLSAAH